jgi:hypothetical protein
MAKPSKTSNFFKKFLSVLLVLIVVVAVAINVLFLKKTSAPFNSIYIMQNTNMDSVQYGDAVLASPSKVSELQAGNVVLCLTSFDGEHKEVLKLIDITQEDGTTYYYVRSDEETNDEALKLTEDKILAKCLWTNSSLGSAITFAKSTTGIIVLVAIPCVILLAMNIASNVAKKKELEREEELRKSTKKKKKKKPQPEDTEDEEEEAPVSKSKGKKSTEDLQEDEHKSTIKPIAVKQLSEEESVKQREDVSNMVGSELNTRSAKEITRTFNTDELKVAPMKSSSAVRIDEEPQIEESVHSPNMNEKANQIRRNLSNTLTDETDITPVETTPKTAKVEPLVVPLVATAPKVEDTKPTETKPVETPKEDITKAVEDAVVIIPETEKPTEPTTTPVETTTAPTTTNTDVDTTTTTTPAVETTTNDSFDEDDFLMDIIGSEDNTTSTNSRVSDDLLDELLNSIPTSTPKQEVKKSTPVETPKKSTKKTTTTKSATHSASHTSRRTKVVDDTPFDELIKAIEKEKNGIK